MPASDSESATAPPSSPADPARRAGPRYRPWVWWLAAALVVATFVLVAIGGHVTSQDAGMAVPDGFTTFGTWSLIAPLETWWHDLGTRLEHSHRLQGYVVGLLTLALAGVLWRTQRQRRWLRVMGLVLLGFVALQAAMGILRVDEVSTPLAAVHGVTGQLFLCFTVLTAAGVGKFWITRPAEAETGRHRRPLRWLPLVLLGLLLGQLTLGAAVRHSGSALAIPDWPTHYGHWLPPMSQEKLNEAVAAYPAHLLPDRYGRATVISPAEPYSAAQVHLHFTHRLGGYLVTLVGLGYVALLFRQYSDARDRGAVLRPAALFATLLLLQVSLGVMTVWSGEHATLATAHQTVGAGLFATATWLAVRVHLARGGTRRPEDVPVAAGDALEPPTEVGHHAAAGAKPTPRPAAPSSV